MAKKQKITIELEDGQEVVIRQKQGLNAFILLDRTGSMGSQWNEAVGAINAYVKELQKEAVKGDKVTLATFDAQGYDVIWDAVALEELKELPTSFCSPRGMTNLFDSFAKIYQSAKSQNAEKTVIVVMTDGEENCSREFNKTKVKALIEEANGKNWEVIFLGANFDVSRDASAVGLDITKYATMSTANLSKGFADLGSRTRAYTMGCAINYNDADKAALEK